MNANTSAIVVAGDLQPGMTIIINVDSTGNVVAGQWDFPLGER